MLCTSIQSATRVPQVVDFSNRQDLAIQVERGGRRVSGDNSSRSWIRRYRRTERIAARAPGKLGVYEKYTGLLLAAGALAAFNGMLQRVMRRRQPGVTAPEKSHTESPMEVTRFRRFWFPVSNSATAGLA
jgi:hypothetical protein